MSGFVETFRGVVAPWECDEFGHMNVQFYHARLSDGFWQLMIRMGFGLALRRQLGLGVVAVDVQESFRRELRAGTLIRVESAVLAIEAKGIRLAHRLIDAEADAVALTARVKGLCFDLAARRSAAFPDSVRERAAAMIAPEGASE